LGQHIWPSFSSAPKQAILINQIFHNLKGGYMSGMDRTGPLGTGPIGRGRGPCRGGDLTAWFGGRGFRRGGGMGWGMAPIAFSAEDPKGFLDRQKEWLETQLDAINKQLEKLPNSDQ
jgi:hypothetical protein